MTTNELSFVRLPPDSTGKKSAAAGLLVIYYQGETAPNLFEKNTTVIGSSSSATAEIRGKRTGGFPASEGELYVDLSTLVGNFAVGEDLIVGVTTYATVKLTAELPELYYQKTVIVDKDTPGYSTKIDRNGDLFTRFDEGSPALSTFGGLISEPTETSRQYVYSYDERPNEFYDVTVGSGTLTYSSDERSVILDTNSSTSGDLVTRQSHLYHPYQPGTMTKVMQTLTLGDSGKAGVRRRWGLFDSNDGLFFELDGTNLYVVCRSSVTGSPVDTRVEQADWNRDQLDGTTNFNLDVTKANLYWMDYQWLGVGVARFGIYEEDGRKTVCHIFENPNTQSGPYMRQGTLPIRYECENTDTAASSSELKATCAVVQLAGTIKRQLGSFASTCPSAVPIGFGDGEKIIMSIRPKATFNGLVNHALTFPEEIFVASDPATSSGLFNIRLRNLSFTAGGTYTGIASSSITEVNHSATGFLSTSTSGIEQYSTILKGGDTTKHIFENFTPYSQKSTLISVLSDNVTQPEMVITAEAMTASSTGDFFATFNINEMVY
jgi:hypothetical protein